MPQVDLAPGHDQEVEAKVQTLFLFLLVFNLTISILFYFEFINYSFKIGFLFDGYKLI